MASDHFSLTVCSALWLLASVQVDCIILIVVLILDTSTIYIVETEEVGKYPGQVLTVNASLHTGYNSK